MTDSTQHVVPQGLPEHPPVRKVYKAPEVRTEPILVANLFGTDPECPPDDPFC